LHSEIGGYFAMIRPDVTHYHILEKLGEGGMGVVYKARDTSLDRFVAIKFLPRNPDAERRARFVQEAKAASGLNHPNIVTVHEFGAADGEDFMVMEFIKGRTLGALIGSDGMKPADALKYSVQVTEALAAAHNAGIVHRDLKPGNIMVTDSGLVKVLDFGLAKLTEASPQLDSLDTRTAAGMVVGTAAYMSPEQAEAGPVDPRSDIFSFGAVFYEMLTGRQAFGRASRVATLTAVVHEDPPALSQTGRPVPREIERVVQRCLRKDPAERYQHMADLGIALQDLKEDSESGRISGPGPAAAPSHKPRRLLWAALGASVALAALGAWLWIGRRGPVAPEPNSVVRLTSDTGLTFSPSLSADGKLVAYASDRARRDTDIYVQQVLGRGPALRLTDDPADDYQPSISPDGAKVAFRSDRDGGGIYEVSTFGGPARLLVPHAYYPRYSPDGSRLLYWTGEPQSDLGGRNWIMPAEGGPAAEVASGWLAGPAIWAPDGSHVLALAGHVLKADVFLCPIGGPPRLSEAAMPMHARELAVQGMGSVSADYQFLASAGTAQTFGIWRVKLDPRTWRPVSAEQLTSGTGYDFEPSAAAGNVAFTSGVIRIDLWSIPLGNAGGEPDVLTKSDARIRFQARISGDGRKVVSLVWNARDTDVEVRDMQTGAAQLLTSGPETDTYALFSADGKTVAFSRNGGLYRVPVNGGTPEKIVDDAGVPCSWTPDGRFIVASRTTAATATLELIDVEARRIRPLFEHAKWRLYQPNVSPDGKWLAFNANEEPESHIYLAPFRGEQVAPESEWIPLATGSHHEDKPRWSPDGSTLYFTAILDGHRCIWSRKLDPVTRRPVGDAVPVMHFHSQRRSLGNLAEMEMGVGGGRLVVNVTEATGNIWLTRLPSN
jgi:Tol biopolymer transport system component/tRNA A-37 threonylcarbamoyl transferase component Bud32